ncbi:MAG: hypothetical protein ACYDBB_16545 [Armatimonadota bacterium]
MAPPPGMRRQHLQEAPDPGAQTAHILAIIFMSFAALFDLFVLFSGLVVLIFGSLIMAALPGGSADSGGFVAILFLLILPPIARYVGFISYLMSRRFSVYPYIAACCLTALMVLVLPNNSSEENSVVAKLIFAALPLLPAFLIYNAARLRWEEMQ